MLFAIFLNIYCRVRVIGSATLALCHLASGAADAYYQFGLHCWDLAAATVIIREAGGVVIDTSGKQIYFNKDKVWAAHDSTPSNSKEFNFFCHNLILDFPGSPIFRKECSEKCEPILGSGGLRNGEGRKLTYAWKPFCILRV